MKTPLLPESTRPQAQTTINYIPLADRVVVKEEQHEQVSKGGIIIPDTAEKEPKGKGTIVAHGAGFKGEPMTIQLGDFVDYSKYAGSEITIDNEKYRIMRETDIFGIIISPTLKVEPSNTESVVGC